ncbi:MAG: hypothetical protein ACYTBP_08985 [Planctomycetota bacterium]
MNSVQRTAGKDSVERIAYRDFTAGNAEGLWAVIVEQLKVEQ